MEEDPNLGLLAAWLADIPDDVIAGILPELGNNVGYAPPDFNQLYINWNLDYGANHWDYVFANLAVPPLRNNIQPQIVADDSE